MNIYYHPLYTYGIDSNSTFPRERYELIRNSLEVESKSGLINFVKPSKADIRDIDSIPLDGVETIIHLANIANDPAVELNPTLSWETNVLASHQLADKAVRYGVKQIIYASSGSVYGIKKELKVTEDLPLLPISVYNKTKMVAERVFLSFKDHLKVICIRPATVCGFSKRLRLDLVVNIFASHAYFNKEINIFGGTQLRPNINIQDMVRAYNAILELDFRKYNGSIYNCGYENLSLNKISELVVNSFNEPIDIKVIPTIDNRSYHISSKKIKNEINFYPKFSIYDAVQDLLKNFKYLQNPFETEKYFNIKLMQSLKLD